MARFAPGEVLQIEILVSGVWDGIRKSMSGALHQRGCREASLLPVVVGGLETSWVNSVCWSIVRELS